MNTNFPAFQTRLGRFARLALAALLLTAVLFGQGATPPVLASAQIDIHGPAGSAKFGQVIIVLPDGNILVTDPNYNAPGPIAKVGAVYLYNGTTGALISTLTGSTSGDKIGDGGVTVLTNGNFVVISPDWHNSAAVAEAGAVTWASSTAGVNGTVSAANSLVGSTANDQVGAYGVTALSNDNYVVASSYWNNGSATSAGAVTWGNGATGISGLVSATNSLVGSTANDQVGSYGVTTLSNGNYVVVSSDWQNNTASHAGAVTWGNGATGLSGAVSASNSLVGSTTNDQIGSGQATALSNGNYVVVSSYWNNSTATNAGAVTWGNGTMGISGAVSTSNSLVGTTTNDYIGNNNITLLNNANYLVLSADWHNGPAASAGAVTWGNGATGISGAVSASNSLVGSTTNDYVGNITLLSNGNYVVASPYWHLGAVAGAGAVTLGNGATGTNGEVSASNSLVGSTANDHIGYVTALTNGNFVVYSPYWQNSGAANAGEVTWGNGTTGVKGPVTTANSLVGSKANDQVGSYNVYALTNGNYVVSSPNWQNGTATNAGAVTWGNGTKGITGPVTTANSLVGSLAGDQVGYVTALSNGNYVVASPNFESLAGAVTWGNGATGVSGVITTANSLVGYYPNDQIGYAITALSNGNYVVVSPDWDGGTYGGMGAVTWGNGTTGVKGFITAANSLVGVSPGDHVGYSGVGVFTNGYYVVLSPHRNNSFGAVTWGNGVTGVSGAVTASNSLVGSTLNDQVGISMAPLSNGVYVLLSLYWDNGSTVDSGAVTPACTNAAITGPITAANSVLGTAVNGGSYMTHAYDAVSQQVVVGRPSDNIVTLFAFSCASPNHTVFLPAINK